MDDKDEEDFGPTGYINTNARLENVKKQLRTVLTHLFLLWSLRSMVSSRAEYAEDARLRLSFERMKFLWSGETLLSFLQGRRFNYEPVDKTSKIQDRILAQVPKEKKFMISVILGIFAMSQQLSSWRKSANGFEATYVEGSSGGGCKESQARSSLERYHERVMVYRMFFG